jgi:hypothetical protein
MAVGPRNMAIEVPAVPVVIEPQIRPDEAAPAEFRVRGRVSRLPPAGWIFLACGIWLVGLGVYFIFLRPPLLPEDPRFMGATAAQIHFAIPGLAAWLNRVFTVMGGFMASAGTLTIFAALTVVSRPVAGTGWALALAGATGVMLMSGVNFAIASDFKWLLLVPALFWVAGLVAFAFNGAHTKASTKGASS